MRLSRGTVRWKGLSLALPLPVVACSSADTADATGPWNVVAIGDSTPAGYGVGAASAYPILYGQLLADELGIEVTTANHATGEVRTVAEWAGFVTSDDQLHADVAEAEVVLV